MHTMDDSPERSKSSNQACPPMNGTVALGDEVVRGCRSRLADGAFAGARQRRRPRPDHPMASRRRSQRSPQRQSPRWATIGLAGDRRKSAGHRDRRSMPGIVRPAVGTSRSGGPASERKEPLRNIPPWLAAKDCRGSSGQVNERPAPNVRARDITNSAPVASARLAALPGGGRSGIDGGVPGAGRDCVRRY